MPDLKRAVAGQPLEIQADFINRTIDILQPKPKGGLGQSGKGSDERECLVYITAVTSVDGVYKGKYASHYQVTKLPTDVLTPSSTSQFFENSGTTECYIYDWSFATIGGFGLAVGAVLPGCINGYMKDGVKTYELVHVNSGGGIARLVRVASSNSIKMYPSGTVAMSCSFFGGHGVGDIIYAAPAPNGGTTGTGPYWVELPTMPVAPIGYVVQSTDSTGRLALGLVRAV